MSEQEQPMPSSASPACAGASEPAPPDGPRRNIKLVIAYNGAAYHGWQRQPAPMVTVQQLVEEAAMRIVRHPVAEP